MVKADPYLRRPGLQQTSAGTRFRRRKDRQYFDRIRRETVLSIVSDIVTNQRNKVTDKKYKQRFPSKINAAPVAG
jgi:hypothetical protein